MITAESIAKFVSARAKERYDIEFIRYCKASPSLDGAFAEVGNRAYRECGSDIAPALLLACDRLREIQYQDHYMTRPCPNYMNCPMCSASSSAMEALAAIEKMLEVK